MDTDQQLEIWSKGWKAMKWLVRHTKNDSCRECAEYRRRVEGGVPANRAASRRCRIGQRMHRDYVAVEHMLLELEDSFQCDLIDPKRSDIVCDSPAEWMVVRRYHNTKRVHSYRIGCSAHVRHAEALAITGGIPGLFTIEKLEDLAPEDARKML